MGYAHLAFLGQGSLTAAAATECAAEQNRFWLYHDYLFEEWDSNERGRFTKANLKQLAADLELDTEMFNDCMDSGRTEELVFQDTNMARQAGVRSTPVFFINGQRMMGARPYEDFKAMIDAYLQ